MVPQIALWAWGDLHYATLNEPKAGEAPYVGTCLGHGGMPFESDPLDAGKARQPVKAVWAERARVSRVPSRRGARWGATASASRRSTSRT